MIFLLDKTLLIAVPQSHYYKRMAQRLDSHIGKVLRLNRDGSVPPDNPFIGNPSALPEIWSYGDIRVPTVTFLRRNEWGCLGNGAGPTRRRRT